MIEKIGVEQIEKLDGILDSLGDEVMDLECMDGFFAALICSPEVIPPKEYLPIVFGDDFDFGDAEQAQEVLELVFAYWNGVHEELSKPCTGSDFVYTPLCVSQEENGEVYGEYWSFGFLQGMSLQPEVWRILMEDKDCSDFIEPVLIIAGQSVPDPDVATQAIPDDKKGPLAHSMFMGTKLAYAYFSAGSDNDELDE